ncbi:APC family permease [Catenulispora pinisilvae]|uniref:APC family permease n=1 Tax=Catenulispora pinisilvae TaxID=2705253 RepID=UPI001890FD71|nr:APC family permease [Catenulispora pinisilvae]
MTAGGSGREALAADDPLAPARAAEQEHDRLTVSQGLAALSLDALASVAYGPEAIVVVLAVAGAHGLGFTLPVTLAIAGLLGFLTFSYRQVIAAFPEGGGAYAVAGKYLGKNVALVAAASLIIDYVLNVAVSVSAGVAALTSAYPSLYGDRIWLCLAVLLVITGINLRGVAESAKAFIVPTVLFIVAIFAVILFGLFRSHPATAPSGHVVAAANAENVGLLLLLKAFASGCSALTGVEAIANAVPTFRKPRVKRAQRTESALGALLALMLIGLALLIRKFHVAPDSSKTVLAQLTDAALGHNAAFFGVQFVTMILLALAANTSFGGMPVLTSLLARDNYAPHVFALRADRQVYRWGVLILAGLAAVLLAVAKGDTQTLVPVFAIGVFIGFTISQFGMVRHWRRERSPGWRGRAVINGTGAVLTFAALVIELISKFTEGGWLVVVIVPLLVLGMLRVHTAYRIVGEVLGLGHKPEPAVEQQVLVVVPVGAVSRLTQEAMSAALSLGDGVIAVTVRYSDEDDAAECARLQAEWNAWQPDVPLEVLTTHKRSLTRPMVDYLNRLALSAPASPGGFERIMVLIPEVEPRRAWHRLLHNQRGVVLDRAIRRHTEAIVCRMRFHIKGW